MVDGKGVFISRLPLLISACSLRGSQHNPTATAALFVVELKTVHLDDHGGRLQSRADLIPVMRHPGL